MQRPLGQASRYFILFMAISFWGWVAETLFFFLCYGRLFDRGFMTLPFCTIYGFSFLLLYFLIGTPDTGETALLSRRLPEHRCPRPVYFLLAALIPTGLELVTGLFFHRLFGLRLWSYTAYRFHFNGYICLEYTLLWGTLLPLCMQHLFSPLKERIFSLPGLWVRRLSTVLALLAAMDWLFNFSRQELTILTNAV